MSQNKSEKYRRVAYYPGCALEGTGHAYNRSTRQVGKALGLDLVEVRNWNCCGAMEVKNIDPKIQTYLSSRVMAIASEEMGMDVVMAPCNGCYHNLKKAEYDLAHDPASAQVTDQLSRKAGHATYHPGKVETIHALDWIKHSIGEDGLRERVRGGLKGLRVANYYGCMYTRPRHIFPEKDAGPGSESTAKPHFMDDLLAAAGAVNVEFPLKTACCGGAHTLSDSDMSTKLVLNILRAAEAAIKHFYFARRRNAVDAIEAGGGGSGDVEIFVGPEGQMISRDRRFECGEHVNLALAANLENRSAAVADVQIAFGIENDAGGDTHAFDVNRAVARR